MPSKELWILRHGQATHNPRSEQARENGCSYQEFLEFMRLDDSLDAPLTEIGQQQARHVREHHQLRPDLVVASPLSRALLTADLACCPIGSTKNRVCYEGFREINGWLLNAQRRKRSDLLERFPHWNFNDISELDETWTEQLEETQACGERGYLGLQWLLQLRTIHPVGRSRRYPQIHIGS